MLENKAVSKFSPLLPDLGEEAEEMPYRRERDIEDALSPCLTANLSLYAILPTCRSFGGEKLIRGLGKETCSVTYIPSEHMPGREQPRAMTPLGPWWLVVAAGSLAVVVGVLLPGASCPPQASPAANQLILFTVSSCTAAQLTEMQHYW